MSLIQDIEARSGITISYWKITDWKISQAGKTVDIILTPYVSSETRENGYDPIRDEVRKVRALDYSHRGIIKTDYTDYFSPKALEQAAIEGKTIYNIMYDYVKANAPEFEGALDA